MMGAVPLPTTPSVSNATAVDFAAAARLLTRAARRAGLEAPGFRSPPRIVGADRTIRRSGGRVVVAVRLKGRPHAAVLADMVEGVVVANGLSTPDADRARTLLWEVAAEALAEAHGSPTPGRTLPGRSRLPGAA